VDNCIVVRAAVRMGHIVMLDSGPGEVPDRMGGGGIPIDGTRSSEWGPSRVLPSVTQVAWSTVWTPVHGSITRTAVRGVDNCIVDGSGPAGPCGYNPPGNGWGGIE
jgi:hypothetical protein